MSTSDLVVLGLEVDERLKEGAIDATRRYGVQYSSSRAYSTCNLYEEIEDLFEQIFEGNPVILAASTTLCHISAIPILVNTNDLVIIDNQVHGSVQMAVQLTKARGTRVEMIRHNRMDILEDLIKENANKYGKIWYMADGLYSMFGDFAPLVQIQHLLEKYGNFHLYIDDAHGMSWTGKHGNGYVLSQMAFHPKMVLTTSVSKGFAAGGGLVILPDREMRRKIVTCGTSFTISGPVHPPVLGALIASAKIHLSDEIYSLQNQHKNKLKIATETIEKYSLPIISPNESPIFYLGLGLPRTGYNMVKRLLKEGFFTNIGIFPGVPVKCTGLRLAITNGQTEEDIKDVLQAFAHHFPLVMEEEGFNVEKLAHNFNMPLENTIKQYSIAVQKTADKKLNIQHESSIQQIDPKTWNALLGDNGTFDWNGCQFLEETFKDHPEPENNWNFHYIIIRDQHLKPILATFFTELLSKDDMLASASASQQIEEIRQQDPYYLTSKVVMMGSMLTEGTHLYIDKNHPEWQQAMRELIQLMNEAQAKCGANMVQLRDFDSNDTELRDFLIKEGFFKVEMPDSHIQEDIKWESTEKYLATLSANARRNINKDVLPNVELYDVSIVKNATAEQINHWHQLYKNVKERSFNLNTFQLPLRVFENMAQKDDWEILELKLIADSKPVAVVFCYLSEAKNYAPMIIGLNYDYVLSHGCYRQGIFQALLRANTLKCNKLYLGMDASVEKRKFGVKAIPKSVYIQANDNFNMELIGTMKA